MKIVILFALIVLASADWRPKPLAELKQHRVKCVQDLDLSQDLKNKLSHLEYPDEELAKQYILCGARTSELWTDEEGWKSDRIMMTFENESSLPKEEMQAAIDGCLDDNSQKSTLQEWSYRVFKCLINSKLRDSFIKMMKKLQ